MNKDSTRFVGQGGEKLKYAIDELQLDLEGLVGADFGCNIGGFTDCLLQEGVVRVYAVDTGYGALEWKLRCDDRVVVMERTNAMHAELGEKVDILTVDVGWTPQKYILPPALRAVKQDGKILSLFKPQYEADTSLVKNGYVAPEDFDSVLEEKLRELEKIGIKVNRIVRLPKPTKRKNLEAVLYLRPDECEKPLTGAKGE